MLVLKAPLDEQPALEIRVEACTRGIVVTISNGSPQKVARGFLTATSEGER